MKFEVLVAMHVKITLLRGVTQCSLVGNSISEEPAASIYRVCTKQSFMSEKK
jgi:hypothetical protein